MTEDAHIAWLITEGQAVTMPDELRAQHQPDPQRFEQDTQCVCTCGAKCVSYAGHLQEAADHAAYWDRVIADGHDPNVALARAGVLQPPRRITD